MPTFNLALFIIVNIAFNPSWGFPINSPTHSSFSPKLNTQVGLALCPNLCSIETTLKYYTHATDDLLNEAVTNLQSYKDKKRSNSSTSMIGHNSRKVLK